MKVEPFSDHAHTATTPCGARNGRRGEALQEVREALLDWFARASALSRAQVLPAFRWLFEVKGYSFDEPTAECLASVIESLRVMALLGGSAPAVVAAELATFRCTLAVL